MCVSIYLSPSPFFLNIWFGKKSSWPELHIMQAKSPTEVKVYYYSSYVIMELLPVSFSCLTDERGEFWEGGESGRRGRVGRLYTCIHYTCVCIHMPTLHSRVLTEFFCLDSSTLPSDQCESGLLLCSKLYKILSHNSLSHCSFRS